MATDGNCHAQCSSCNLRHEYDAYPFNNWYIEKFGKEAWDAMHFRHKKMLKFSDRQLAFIIQVIKDLLEKPEQEEWEL
jgi:hypothetical protein